MIRDGIRRLFRLGLHRDADAARDAADEMRAHIEMRAEQLVSEGWTPAAARAEAERRFASTDPVRHALDAAARHREATMRTRDCVESVVQDLKYVLRGIRRSPGFALTVAATLALGLGANAALFSILDRMFLQAPAGVRDPGTVRRLYRSYTNRETKQRQLLTVYSYPMIRAMTAAMPSGTQLVGYRTAIRTPMGDAASERRGVLTFVVGDYFGALGVSMAAGRPFAPDEYRAEGLSQVAVISHPLATAQFGSAADAIGKPLDVALNRYTVIGVAAEGFRGTDLDAGDVWAPMNSRGSWRRPDAGWIEQNGTLFIAALVRGSDEAALARARVASGAALSAVPAFRMNDTGSTMLLSSIREALSPGFQANEQRIATRLAGVALLILVIACANVANILLARAITRRREIAVRLALGVSRGRLVRQLVSESVVLALIALVGAVVVAIVTSTALRQMLLPSTTWGAPAVGWRAVVFAAGSAVIAGFLVGLVPALQASRARLSDDLRGGARDGTQRHSRFRAALLVAQVTVSVALLAGAGFFVRSLREVQSVDIGYDADRIVFAEYRAPRDAGVTPQQTSDALTAALPGLARVPGVEGVAFTQNIPMWAFSFVEHFLPDRDSVPRLGGRPTIVSFVSPKFFATMGMRVVGGRDFTDADRIGSEPVLIVNRALAETVWPGVGALGKCLILHKRGDPCRRIVGVVSEAHYSRVIEDRTMQFYVPLLQESDDGKAPIVGALQIRAAPGIAPAVLDGVKRELARLAPAGATPNLRTFTEQLAPEFRTWRLGAQLFSVAGLLALLVAAVGIYGSVSYTLSQRTHEMGVRIALGAQARDIVRMVLAEGMRVIAVGVACGVGFTLASGRLIRAMLYGVTPHDPAVLSGVALVLITAAIAASLAPAMRATRADPVDSLRAE